MGSLFGVVNIPNVVWIDEDGMIVRPAEPGFGIATPMPESFAEFMAERMKQRAALTESGEIPEGPDVMALVTSGQDRATYPDAVRDWVRNGPDSEFALTPTEVVERSNARSSEVSAAAAHFELAHDLWLSGHRDAAIGHFNEAHRLQPENWTYKRQAWSLLGQERDGGEFGRFSQIPAPGQADDWPFIGDFDSDISQLELGEYYPKTM